MHEQNNTNGQGEAQHFTEAVTIANIPTLLKDRREFSVSQRHIL